MLNNKNNSSTEERRNYYRILNVQPDAPLESIKNNYRTLLQKLRLHPDLGGENWNASIINEAYNVLRNPLKRADYDKKLLQRYDLKLLARGHLDKNSNLHQKKSIHSKDKHGNKRNFYRMFNIQPDSPMHIIKTSYLSSTKNTDIPKDLLNEAYTVLSNPEKRALYDKLLSQDNHAYALKKLTSGQKNKYGKNQLNTNHQAKTTSTSADKLNTTKIKKTYINSSYGNNDKNYYQPVITQYCSFCKTPHNQSPSNHTAALCNECKSPLSPPSKIFLEQQRRDIIRLSKNNKIQFYAYWPGKPQEGSISDISPTGIQLVSSMALNKGQIIKLDGDDFKAVGIVSYINHDKIVERQTSGIKFLTVYFNKNKGQFFSEKA
jgi:curved DNA-binding protein CbpA